MWLEEKVKYRNRELWGYGFIIKEILVLGSLIWVSNVFWLLEW